MFVQLDDRSQAFIHFLENMNNLNSNSNADDATEDEDKDADLDCDQEQYYKTFLPYLPKWWLCFDAEVIVMGHRGKKEMNQSALLKN